MHLRIILSLFCIAASSASFAQLQSAGFRQKPSKIFLPKNPAVNYSRSQQCDPDTVYYAYAKASGLQGLNINTINSADKAGQWFDAPQQVMLYGFTFYAWLSGGTADTVLLTCKAVLAGSDSLPTGPVIATTTIQVDSTFRGGKLNVIEKTAMFPNPVLVDYPYVLVVESSSPLNVALVASAWDSMDGRGEWLGMASILPAGWLHGYDINVGGPTFDADFVFNPIVTYSIDASFTADTNCIINGGAVDFTNTTNNPILQSRFYNQYVFDGTNQLIYIWDYDDNTPLDLLVDTSHTFSAGYDYDVTLRSNMAGWASSCQESATIVINPAVTSDFTFTPSVMTVQFTNTSSGDSSRLWNFGDGNTSTDVNPSHAFSTEGNFEVTLITTGRCSNDTIQKVVSLCNPLSSDFTFTTDGLSADFSVASIAGSASFSWNFGDGSSGSGIAATHAYSTAGVYTTCLMATNSCKSDTTCQQVNVVSTGIAKITEAGWEVFPNPADNEITLQFTGKNPELSEISLTDTKGSLMKVWTSSKMTDNRLTLDVSDVQPGVYYLRAKFVENRQSGKVIVVY